MVLVDSSVLIPYLRGAKSSPAKEMERLLDSSVPFALCPVVLQEVLQGCRDEREFARVRGYLLTQLCFDVTSGIESHADAARIYSDCRKAGLTVSSSVDCLVAQTAIENGAALLHHDQDYRRIQSVRPALEFWTA